MRLSAGFLGVVTLVAGNKQPAPEAVAGSSGPASASCSCTEQLSQTIGQWKEANDACVRDMTAAKQEASKQQSNHAQCVTEHGVTRQSFDQFKAEVEKKVDEYKTGLKQCQISHEKGAGDSEALKSEVAKLRAEKERLAGDVGAEVERRRLVEKDLTDAQKKASEGASWEGAKREAEAQLQKVRNDLQAVRADYSVVRAQLDEKEAKMENMLEFSSKIYSAGQFWRTVDQSKTVGLAFLGYARIRLVQVVGLDTYKLVTLQTQIWYIKARGTMAKFCEPVRNQLVTLYRNKAQKRVEKAVDYVMLRSHHPTQQVQFYLQKGLGYVDAYMDGVIRNLSKVNPDVKELFPSNFYDRCYAFAFVASLLYFTSTGLQYLGSFLWTNAVLRLIGKRQREKCLTSVKKPRTGGQRGPGNPSSRNKTATAPATEKAKAR